MKRVSNNKTTAAKPATSLSKPVASAKTVKAAPKKTTATAPEKKLSAKKAKPVASAEKKPAKNQTLESSVSARKTKAPAVKKSAAVSSNPAKPQVKKNKSLESVEAKKKSPKASVTSVKNVKSEGVKSKAAENKVQDTKFLKAKTAKSANVELESLKQKKAPAELKKTIKNEKPKDKVKTKPNVETVGNKPDPKKSTLPPKIKKKKAKPISSVIFRGKKDRYGFEVFPLDTEFEDVSAIYVISKRKIDKRKKGHHALVCIGQTESLQGEIKRHKKGKCVKKYEANVISVLPEADEKKRLRIETDLKAAHAIVCNLK